MATAEQRGRRKVHRCEECGLILVWDEECPNHPDASRIWWPQSMRIAYHLVALRATDAIDFDAWVETAPDEDLTGTTRGDLALALTCARKWQPAWFEEGRELPKPVSPRGLFPHPDDKKGV